MHGHVLTETDLERRVIDLLATRGICVLATCPENVPRASAVEFSADGTMLSIPTEGGRKGEMAGDPGGDSHAVHRGETITGIRSTGIAKVSEKKRAGCPEHL